MDEITLSHVKLKAEEERWVSVGPSDDGLGSYFPKKIIPYVKRTYLGVDNDGFPVRFSLRDKQPTEGCRAVLEYGSGLLNWLLESGKVFIGDKKYSLIRFKELPAGYA